MQWEKMIFELECWYLKNMESTILLKEKWRVQKELAKSVNYDLAEYALLIDRIVDKVIEKLKKEKRKNKKTIMKNITFAK